jgi:hypothetical protein
VTQSPLNLPLGVEIRSATATAAVKLLHLVKARVELGEAAAAAERAIVANAEARFRFNTQYLVDEIAAIETAYKVAYVVQAHGYDGGRYGMTIQRVADGAICRLSLFDVRSPHIVEWDGAPSGHPYDLEALQPHTSAMGFLRTYQSLVEDLAAWMVPYKAPN